MDELLKDMGIGLVSAIALITFTIGIKFLGDALFKRFLSNRDAFDRQEHLQRKNEDIWIDEGTDA